MQTSKANTDFFWPLISRHSCKTPASNKRKDRASFRATFKKIPYN